MEFPKDERLEKLYFDTFGVSRFKKLASVVALVLTLSHGQASVERGFSQNNLIQVKMSPDTIISKKIIKDHMLANNLKPYTITIDWSIIKAFDLLEWSMRNIENRRKKRNLSAKKKPRPSRYHSILKTYVASVAHLSEPLTCWTQILSSIKSAEEKDDMSFVKKWNALKRKSEETKSELDILLNEVKN